MPASGFRQPNLRAAVDACPLGPWSGEAWRCHSRRYTGDDPGGSIKATGRYHRGRDRFPESSTWPALYTALAPHVALAEMLRHTRALPELATKRLTRLRIALSAVLNGTALFSGNPINTFAIADLCRPSDYALTHAIADAAQERGAEALLMPSCTRLAGNILVIFPVRLRSDSSISVLETEDPDLFIDWTSMHE
jgi:hypothetical protein